MITISNPMLAHQHKNDESETPVILSVGSNLVVNACKILHYVQDDTVFSVDFHIKPGG